MLNPIRSWLDSLRNGTMRTRATRRRRAASPSFAQVQTLESRVLLASIVGTNGNDVLKGTTLADTISGLDGNDIITGDAGNDDLNGNVGNDSVSGGAGNDTVGGGQGDDPLVAGDDGNDTVNGGKGNDYVYGGTGDDIVNGYEGDDWVVEGNEGNDAVYGDDGDDKWVQGNTGDDFVSGGNGNDTVHGGQGNDTVSGDAGIDEIYGDLGNDQLYGGTGADRFVYLADAGSIDVINDWSLSEGDRIDLAAFNSTVGNAFAPGVITDFGSLVLTQSGANAVIGLPTNQQIVVTGVEISEIQPSWFSGYASIDRRGNDTLQANAAGEQLSGREGDDTIRGGVGNDNLNGNVGNDSVSGGAGNDTVAGGKGDDPLVAGEDGNDIVNGGLGNDNVYGGTGDDIVHGYNGDDLDVLGNDGNDVVRGGQGDDWVYGDAGNDLVYGDLGVDQLYGGIGADHFVFISEPGVTDTINDWNPGQGDKIDLSSFDSVIRDFDSLLIQQIGANTRITLPAGEKIVLVGIQASTVTRFQFLGNASLHNDFSPVFTSAANVSVNENESTVLTVTATDADTPTQTVVFAITGGADQSRFSITSGGVLSFKSAPDFELPVDADSNNVYLVQVTANDGYGRSTSQNLTITVLPVNDNNPVFVTAASQSVAEKTTSVLTVRATDADNPAQSLTFAITGGADQARFAITSGGVLTFQAAPDFETPTDVGADNVYNVRVSADDGNGRTTVQDLAITVTNVNDAPVFTSSPAVNVAENSTSVLTVRASDADRPAQTLNFALTGGADQARFAITGAGVLTFKVAPDFESPNDVGTDNVYNVQVTVSDGNGGTAVQNLTVTVTNVSEGPVITNSAGVVTYTENKTAIVVDASVTVTGGSSAAFSNGKLTVDFLSNGTADDRLAILNQGTASGKIGIAGSTVNYSNVAIGTMAGGTGTTPLVITLNSNATVAAVQALARAVTFVNVSDAPSTAARSVRFVFTGVAGDSGSPSTKQIAVVAVNDLPVVTTSPGTTSYLENSAPVIVDGAVTVSDVDNPSFNGGTLTVNFLANGAATDRLAIRNQGTGATQIGVSGANVTYEGVVIGSFAGGVGTGPLIISLNAQATQVATAALARNITFANVSEAPGSLTRTVKFVLKDGSGGVSASKTKLVSVTATNDAPVIGGVSGSSVYVENAVPVALAATASLIDPDLPTSLAGGTLTVDFQSNGTADDRLQVRNQGVGANQIGIAGTDVTFGGVHIGNITAGTGTTPLVVTLNSNATTAAAQALARNIVFSNVSDAPATSARTVRFVVTDGQGGTSVPVTKAVTVTAVNDASVITGLPASVSYAAGSAPTRLAVSANVIDPDSADFLTGSLTVSLPAGATAADRLTILSVGVGPGQIAVSSGGVTYGGVSIATFTGGTGTAPLVVSFNTNATVAAVQALVRSIQFQVVGAISVNSSRTVRFVLKDGDGGISANYDLLLNVIGA